MCPCPAARWAISGVRNRLYDETPETSVRLGKHTVRPSVRPSSVGGSVIARWTHVFWALQRRSWPYLPKRAEHSDGRGARAINSTCRAVLPRPMHISQRLVRLRILHGPPLPRAKKRLTLINSARIRFRWERKRFRIIVVVVAYGGHVAVGRRCCWLTTACAFSKVEGDQPAHYCPQRRFLSTLAEFPPGRCSVPYNPREHKERLWGKVDVFMNMKSSSTRWPPQKCAWVHP